MNFRKAYLFALLIIFCAGSSFSTGAPFASKDPLIIHFLPTGVPVGSLSRPGDGLWVQNGWFEQHSTYQQQTPSPSKVLEKRHKRTRVSNPIRVEDESVSEAMTYCERTFSVFSSIQLFLPSIDGVFRRGPPCVC
jgi:hypothetical protein